MQCWIWRKPLKKIKNNPYRSKFETRVITKLKRRRIRFIYEKERIHFTQPAVERSYLPDLYFPQTKIYVELKGLFTLDDRKKHLWLREDTNSYYDIRFCFQNAKNKIRKNSKTTYIDWCVKHEFRWCEKEIPRKWMVKIVRKR